MAAERNLVSARDWLRGLLMQLARLAVDDARRLRTNHDVGVHALRVRMKKLRALLRLATDHPKRGMSGRVADHARAIKDGMAGLRDVHVMQRLAAKLNGDPLPIAPWVELPAWSAAKTLRKCRELQEAVRALPLRGLTWTAVQRRFARDARRARKSCHNCAKTHDAEAFHAWRKRAKSHYYQCLALEGAHQKPRRLKHLRKLGRLLGHEHDLAMLQTHLEHASPAATEARDKIETLRRTVHEKVRKKARRIWVGCNCFT